MAKLFEMSKMSWFLQISTITAKGFQAAKSCNAGALDNPYWNGKGIQALRRKAWERGFNRQRAGLPLNDTNG